MNILRFVRCRARWFCLLGLAAALQTPCAEACKYTVRDVAFVTLREEPYRLLVYVDKSTALDEQSAADAVAKLRSAALAAVTDSNIVVEWIQGDSPPDSIAARTADQLGLKGGPAIALAGPDDRAIRLPWSDAEPIEVDLIRTVGSRLTGSAKQLELRKALLAGHHSVVIIHEGVSAEYNRRATEMMESLIEKVKQSLPLLPKPMDLPPKLLTVSQEESDAERLFLWSLGIDEDEFDETQVAIVFGRCRLLGPAMPIPGTNRQQVVRRLAVVGQDCECELDRTVMRGQMIPHKWSSREEAVAASMLGFDPGNPLVQFEIQRILSRGPTRGGPQTGRSESLAINDLALGGLQIIDIGNLGAPEPDDPGVAEAQTDSELSPETPAEAAPVAKSSASPTSDESQMASESLPSISGALAWLLGGIAVIGVIGVALILARGSRA